MRLMNNLMRESFGNAFNIISYHRVKISNSNHTHTLNKYVKSFITIILRKIHHFKMKIIFNDHKTVWDFSRIVGFIHNLLFYTTTKIPSILSSQIRLASVFDKIQPNSQWAPPARRVVNLLTANDSSSSTLI